MVNVKVDGEEVFEGESGIETIKGAEFFFGNTGSDKKSADVAVSNFELSQVEPMPFAGLPWKFNVSEFAHALDIGRMPSTRTKLGFHLFSSVRFIHNFCHIRVSMCKVN